jgi:tetratricopeptide (TPR) repeat protein
MPIDPYAACPGGTGKKIKFCCADLLSEIEQIDRLIEGDQGTAALEQVERLSEKHPRRACLMATRLKLQLSMKKFSEAAATSREFLEAFPENPLALGYAAVSDVIAGRIQEAAASFDRAREASAAEISPELLQVAATLVQAAAQAGHVGFAQGLVEWMIDKSLGTPEDRRLLAAVVGSSGVPPAIRTKVHLEEAPAESPWRFEFDAALRHAREWRLSKALTTFRSLKGVAGESPELFTNIGILCEMLARPFEASEAWLKIAAMRGTPPDDAVEATGRAIALETEADEDRSPQIRFTRLLGALTPAAAAADGLDLLEDKLRHDGHFESVPLDRSQWVSRGAVPPRSMWRIYESGDAGGPPARMLAMLSIFGRQTDREAEALLQGFAPDVSTAQAIVEPLFGVTFSPLPSAEGLPSTNPTTWLLGAQFRVKPPTSPVTESTAGEPSVIDRLLGEQRHALWNRFLVSWPDTPLPELLGKTPRESLAEPAGSRRVEALVTEGEATSQQRDAAEAWTAIRAALGMKKPTSLQSARPLEEVPPMRWHRLEMSGIDLEQLRGLLVTSADAGFELAAEKAAEALIARTDAAAEDRWEAYSLLEARATSSVKRLEIIAHLRELAKQLKVSDGMIDIAELRIRLQRGDQGDIVRLLDHLRREHSRDQKVLEALAEVLVEAGVDLSALAMQPQAPGGVPIGQAVPPAKSETSGIWTPGSPQPGQPAEKKTIWTPG